MIHKSRFFNKTAENFESRYEHRMRCENISKPHGKFQQLDMGENMIQGREGRIPNNLELNMSIF